MAIDQPDSGVDEGKMIEARPDDVVALLEVRDAWRQRMTSSSLALEFLISHLASWPPSAVVRVAFLDGDASLHGDVRLQASVSCSIASATDFGLDQATGEYRRWRESDTVVAAEIRVSFDQPGFWSLVGTDSSDPTVGSPFGSVGGRPGQRSLNLGDFKQSRPSDWRGRVCH